ncbi:MAG: YtxH domain-containing protein [Actinobacteria bacterium]|nr:YtxH domain-containing protein [Actinomycetota bacterium]
MSCCSRHKAAASGKHKGGMKVMLFGMLVGLVLGLLFAPKPGSETLDALSDKIIRKLPV